ncbi:MAG TPA: extracellular solute-binding protein [Devosiaceae bacterium]
MTFIIGRRQLLLAGTALAATASLRPAFAQENRLRLIFWGSKDRADRTFAVADAYEKANGVTIDGESLAFGDYWTKLATQTAGGNAPDVINMDGAGRYVAEYAHRGSIASLDEFIGNALDLSDFDKDQIEAGKVDGKLYAISLGANALGMVVNTEALAKAGVQLPGQSTTFDDLKAMADAFKSKDVGMRVISDFSGNWAALENFLIQRGKALYTADGKLAFDVDDLTKWLTLWAGLRDAGICLSADEQALDTSLETSGVVTGKAAMQVKFSNELVGVQKLTDTKLALTNLPRISTDAPGGQYRRAAMFFSASGTSPNKEEAVKFISYFVDDVEANKILLAERGIPCSAKVRAALAPLLDEQSRMALDYVAGLGPLLVNPPPTSPAGGGEINESILPATAQEAAFGVSSPEDAASKFITSANDVLRRAA